MKVRFLKMILLAGGLLTCSLAAGSDETLIVHVPFAFMAAGRTFPAGDYHVKKGESGSVLLLQGAGHGAVFLTVAWEPDTYRDTAALVFEHHGPSMILSAVRMPGERDRVLLALPASMKPRAPAIASSR